MNLKSVPFIIPSQYKILGINLTKYVQDLYTETKKKRGRS